MAGTDARLQEPLEAPGVSITLASVLFGREGVREQDTRRDNDNKNGKEMSRMWQHFKCDALGLEV